ncbi:hypothetical protein CHL78_001865 [Romboutsia weinsteinii]|uniref:Peptidase S55 domain-containing protein n=2 Tax=Romboutsia weinsteinii TaxID=2020949 RepID=A0A371J9M1_9FIRM|nr:hypothetical protein CHL78_001865 [Romboutsia weinsteinii]
MNQSKRITIKNLFFIIFLMTLILLPKNIYSMQKQEKLPQEVIVGGELLQINISTSNLMYYKKDNESNKFEQYDLIESIEGKAVQKACGKYKIVDLKRKDILEIILNMDEEEQIEVKVKRNNENKKIYIGKKEISPSYFTEIVPFSASLTYINQEDNSFAAVAHDVDISDRNNILIDKGDIFLCNSPIITKSKTSEIGNIYGEKKNSSQGNINKINEFGAKGKIIGDNILENKDIYKVAYAKEVKEGLANLIIEEHQEKKSYNINITKVHKQKFAETQGFEFEIVDKNLIEKYGGIVQGMSGCPIVQNGKLIGALSHVICSNPSKGVGLYIQWMMED